MVPNFDEKLPYKRVASADQTIGTDEFCCPQPKRRETVGVNEVVSAAASNGSANTHVDRLAVTGALPVQVRVVITTLSSGWTTEVVTRVALLAIDVTDLDTSVPLATCCSAVNCTTLAAGETDTDMPPRARREHCATTEVGSGFVGLTQAHTPLDPTQRSTAPGAPGPVPGSFNRSTPSPPPPGPPPSCADNARPRYPLAARGTWGRRESGRSLMGPSQVPTRWVGGAMS